MTKPKLIRKAKTNPQSLQFKIERGVPIAPTNTHKKKENPYKAEFESMNPSSNPSDSFLIGTDKLKVHHVKYHASKFRKENNAGFVFRNTPEGVRCWRVK